jgi:hypothetical protein
MSTTGQTTPPLDLAEDTLRHAALTQLRKKRAFHGHLLAYVLVNLLINSVWLLTTPGGFYWPMFPLLGWGIGLAFNAWDAYSSPLPSEDRIQREIRRLSRH